MSPDATRVYVSNGRHGSVSVIDVAKQTLIATYEGIGARVWGIGISADGKTLYTANGPTNSDISFVDAGTGAVIKKIVVGGGPWGIALERK
jgi:YVTN family beta-propeller protein